MEKNSGKRGSQEGWYRKAKVRGMAPSWRPRATSLWPLRPQRTKCLAPRKFVWEEHSAINFAVE